MCEFQAENHCSDTKRDGKDDLGDGQVGEPGGPQRVGVLCEGGEGGESAQKAGGQQWKDPGGSGSLGEEAEDAADEKTADKIANQDTERELMKRRFFGDALDAGGEPEAGEGTQTTAQKNEEGIHEARVARRDFTLSKSLMPGEISAPLAMSRATGREGSRAFKAWAAFSGFSPPARIRGTCG